MRTFTQPHHRPQFFGRSTSGPLWLSKHRAGLPLNSEPYSRIQTEGGVVLSLREAVHAQRGMAPQLQTKACCSLKPRTWNMPSDGAYRLNQHANDGNQTPAPLRKSGLGQLRPNEIQKPC